MSLSGVFGRTCSGEVHQSAFASDVGPVTISAHGVFLPRAVF